MSGTNTLAYLLSSSIVTPLQGRLLAILANVRRGCKRPARDEHPSLFVPLPPMLLHSRVDAWLYLQILGVDRETCQGKTP